MALLNCAVLILFLVGGTLAVIVNFHGIGNDIEHQVTFCGACYPPENATYPSYSTWETCQDEGFPSSRSLNNASLLTWTKTVNLSDCILRWKWRELIPGANQSMQYELYNQGDRTLNLYGVPESMTLDVYTELNKFGSYVDIPNRRNIVFYGKEIGKAIPAGHDVVMCGHCDLKKSEYNLHGSNCAKINRVPLDDRLELYFELQLPVGCELKWKWFSVDGTRLIVVGQEYERRVVIQKDNCEAGMQYELVESKLSESSIYDPHECKSFDVNVTDFFAVSTTTTPTAVTLTSVGGSTTSSLTPQNLTTTLHISPSTSNNIHNMSTSPATLTHTHTTSNTPTPTVSTTLLLSTSSASPTTTSMNSSTSEVTTASTSSSISTTTGISASSTHPSSSVPYTSTTTASITVMSTASTSVTTTPNSSITSSTQHSTISTTTAENNSSSTPSPSTTTKQSTPRSSQTTASTRATKKSSSTPKSTSPTPSTTRRRHTQSTAPIARLVQTIFYGSATKWSQPKLLLCTKCGEIGKPDFSACKPVSKIEKVTNFNSGGNSYSWRMPSFFSSTCEKASFSWAAKWLIDGVWGYKASNGTVIQDWKQEFTKTIPARQFVPAKIPCKGALDIITVWQDQRIPNITCGDAFYTTTKSPLGNLTVDPNGGKSIKFSSLSAYTRTFQPLSTEGMTHPHEFGIGPIIAMVLCLLAVITVVVTGTYCGIKSYNQKRARFLRDMNFDDNDEPSLPFDRAGLREFDQTSDSLVNPLYASMREEDEYVSDQGHVNKLLTFTGDIDDIHHKSGGGVTTVYDDMTTMNNNQNQQLELKRMSSNGAVPKM